MAVIVESREALEQAIVDNWTGDLDCEESQEALREINEHDFVELGDLRFEFEIGFAKFADVFTYTLVSRGS